MTESTMTDQRKRIEGPLPGDTVVDVSCRACKPTAVVVLKVFPWGLRVRAGDGEPYDCTRWTGLAQQDAEHRERVRELAEAIAAFDDAPQRSSAHLAGLCARWMRAARKVVE